MRPRARLLAPLIALSIALLTAATAHAAKGAEVRAKAESWGQTCSAGQGTIACSGPTSRVHVWNAHIAPDSGDVRRLVTDAVMFGRPPMDAESRDWMLDLHAFVCGDEDAALTYIDQVAELDTPGTSVQPATVGACRMSGRMDLNRQGRERYHVESDIRSAPGPTATPTPEPTPKPTKKPPKPTAEPTLQPTATPTATPKAAPSPTPDATAEATPETTRAPIVTTPPATETAVPAPGPPGPPGPPTFAGSVVAVTEVSADPTAVTGSLLLALLLLLLIGFVGELFNNTVENNYDEIAGWFRKGPLGAVRRALDRVRLDLPGRPGVLVFIGLTALISSFVDPGFGLDLRSIAVFLGFLVGLIVVLASFKLPPILARRRKTGEIGQLRPLPWALLIAALFVLVSRIGNLQPGYLYGIVLGAIFVTDVSDRDEGRETFFGTVWTLVAALLAWVALTWLRGLGLPEDGFGATLLETAFAATLVAGLEAAAFALMPLRFLPGYVLYRWNRPVWAALWAISLFAFVHVLIGPTSGYVSELSPGAFLAALGVFAAFGALSIGTWLYFRLRAKPGTPEAA